MKGKEAAAAAARRLREAQAETAHARTLLTDCERELATARREADARVASIHRELLAERARKMADQHIQHMVRDRARDELARLREDLIADTRADTAWSIVRFLERHGFGATFAGWVALLEVAQLRDQDARELMGITDEDPYFTRSHRRARVQDGRAIAGKAGETEISFTFSLDPKVKPNLRPRPHAVQAELQRLRKGTS